MLNATAAKGAAVGAAMLLGAVPMAGAEPKVLDTPLHSLGLGSLVAIDYSSEVNRLVTAGDAGAYLWDTETGELLLEIVRPGITSVALSGDGTVLLTGNRDGKARLWDTESGTVVHTVEGHTRDVLAVDVSHDGALLLTGGAERMAYLWDRETGDQLQYFPADSQGSERIVSLALSPDTTKVAMGTVGERVLRVFEADGGAPLFGLWATNAEIVEFSADSSRVMAGSPTGRTVASRPIPADGTPTYGYFLANDRSGVAFTPDGLSALVSSPEPYNGEIYDLTGDAVTQVLEGHEDRIFAAKVGADGATAVTAAHDQTVRLWNLETGEEIRRFEGHSAAVRYVAFSPDGTRILTSRDWIGDRPRSLRLWNTETGEAIGVLSGSPGQANTSMFSTNGSHVITRRGNAVLLWDAGTGALLREFHHTAEVEALTFSPDGSRILTGTADGGAWIWGSEVEPRSVPNTWVLQ